MWRRSQIQRALAALLAGLAVWLGVSAATADPEGPSVEVVVAQRDVPTGQTLSAADLGLASVPVALAPADVASAPEQWVGRQVAAPISAGGVITEADLSIPALAKGQPQGHVVAHLPLASAALARAAPAGTRVDVLSTSDGSTIASDVVVLLGTGAGEADGPGLFVAVNPTEAAAIAVHGSSVGQALGSGGLTVVLR